MLRSLRVFYFLFFPMLAEEPGIVWAKVHSRVPSTLCSRVFSGFTFSLNRCKSCPGWLGTEVWNSLCRSGAPCSLWGGACSVTGLRWWSASLRSLSVAEVEGSAGSAHSGE